MKVIDLLNKIANGEETPKRFKIGFINYDFINGNAKLDYELFDSLLDEDYNLNTEVEIIEDAPVEDEKIEDTARFQYSQIPPLFDTKEVIRVVNENFERHQRALNEIIDKINGE